MAEQTTFTRAARSNCLRIGLEEDEARNVVDFPDEEFDHPDRLDPETVFSYSARYLPADMVLVVTWRQLADRKLASRVKMISRDDYERLRAAA